MRMTTKRMISGLVAAALIGTPIAAIAKSASSLSDLVGTKAAGAESDMESRGWIVTDGHKGSNSSYTYWWNSSRKDCVMVRTADGRYATITDVTPADCNQKSGSGAGAAVGAVAGLALIAALASHKSGHHESGSHYGNQADEAQYERGYNDGLYNQPYHNYDRNEAYGSGYQNGVEQRQHNTGYRNDHRYGAGYAASVDVSDLEGARGAGAESDMESRGFRSVDSFQSGNGRGTVWYSSRTRQCIQMIVADGRVDSIQDIHTHPRCR